MGLLSKSQISAKPYPIFSIKGSYVSGSIQRTNIFSIYFRKSSSSSVLATTLFGSDNLLEIFFKLWVTLRWVANVPPYLGAFWILFVPFLVPLFNELLWLGNRFPV